MLGIFSYYYSSWTNSVFDTEIYKFGASPSLASTATLATTSLNRGSYVELSFYLGGLVTSIGSTNTNKILLVDFVSSSGWTSGTNDPFNSYSTTAAVFLI
jgi:hypothetical protein